MARLMGVNIPDNKRIPVSLTYIHGIGRTWANKLTKQANLNLNGIMKDLTSQELDRLREVIEKNLKVEGDLRMLVNQNIKRLKEINTYRGIRHSSRLPVRGQRSKTNARTKRGKRVSVGSGRKPSAQKT